MNETKKSFSLPSLVGLIGGGLGVAATFMVWFEEKAGNMKFVAWDENTGKITVVLGGVAALAGLVTLMKKSRAMGILIFVMGLLYLGVVALNYPTGEMVELIVVSYGFWLAFAGGVVATIAGLWKTITK